MLDYTTVVQNTLTIEIKKGHTIVLALQCLLFYR